ncbi:hypothetical protein OG338_07605 [Streptomyces sp. NBC_00726]|uniref:hypothetical protein n=1 Tax=Streptomyces sp. NBC_00726 TaxID=2903674 RepID=UPI00386FBCAF
MAALVVALAGCSGSSGAADGGEASSSPAVGAAAKQASGDPAGDAPTGAEVLGVVAMGKPFTVTVIATNTADDPNRWKFTVDSMICGKPLDPAVMADAAESVGAPTPTPIPESGKQFCVLTMTAVNIGHNEATWDADNTVSLNVGDTHYSESQVDADYAMDYAQYWQSKGKVAPAFGLNPGSQGPVHGVFEIPAGDKPTSLWVTSGTAIKTIDGTQPGYLVQLK